MSRRAVFFGLAGHALSNWERDFFADAEPAGYILFARNIDTPGQVKALTDSLREISGCAELPILIDQEGGRVARLRPPNWAEHPPARALGALYEHAPAQAIEAATVHGYLIGMELAALGVTVNCLPVLDLLLPDAHGIIGDRAFSSDPKVIEALGSAVMNGLGQAGVVPVVKHIPGHGRATVDSHEHLPVVNTKLKTLTSTDFVPFAALGDAPMAMTAHILYTEIDQDNCATQSKAVIEGVIRGAMGFDGLLMTDDLSMKALGGTMQIRSKKALLAGCDILLHCNGEPEEMIAVAEVAPSLEGKARARLEAAMMWGQERRCLAPQTASAARRDQLLTSKA